MAQFKNVSGVDLEVSVDGTLVYVAAGDTFTVHDDHAPTLFDQPNFAPADKATKTAAPAAESTPADAATAGGN